MAEKTPLRHRIWALCCSLKLAIVLASLATLLAMPGSIIIQFNPSVFGALDQLTLVEWWQRHGAPGINFSWWLVLFAALVILLGINTVCCFIDWALRFSSRWKKTGEYLIHLGFILVLIAYIWGNFAGFRHDRVAVFEKELFPIPEMPGTYLRLDSFEPLLNEQGRPLDMVNQLSLLRGETLLEQARASINHPLTWKGLVVVPVSFGRQAQGFTVFFPGRGHLDLVRGSQLNLNSGGLLTVEEFYPDAGKDRSGNLFQRGAQIGNPAMQLRLQRTGHPDWTGWYMLRQSLPYDLVSAGIRFWPTKPVYSTYSLLTINRDPGSGLALAGGIAFMIGMCIALISFYRKRRLGDRPSID